MEKVSRTLRIDPELDSDLKRLCELRKVTVNSFLLNVVGEAVYKGLSQDRIEKATTQATTESIARMVHVLAEMEKE